MTNIPGVCSTTFRESLRGVRRQAWTESLPPVQPTSERSPWPAQHTETSLHFYSQQLNGQSPNYVTELLQPSPKLSTRHSLKSAVTGTFTICTADGNKLSPSLHFIFTGSKYHCHCYYYTRLTYSFLVNWYQKGKPSLDLNEAREDAVLWWYWHQLDRT